MFIFDFGTLKYSEISSITFVFALPFSGTAVTFTSKQFLLSWLTELPREPGLTLTLMRRNYLDFLVVIIID